MQENRQNLGNRGIASRQRHLFSGVSQPLGTPSKLSLFRPEAAQCTVTTAGPAPSGQSFLDQDIAVSGFVGAGVGSVVRIPVPGTEGLAIELDARNWKGSTSSLFLQSADGKRVLRLDFGWNKATSQVEYHWNQSGTHGTFGIANHSPAGRVGQLLYQGAKYYKYAGRVFLVVGLAADAYSIVVAKKRTREVARVVSGWTGAWAGCRIVGALGARTGLAAGSVEPGGGNAIGAVIGGAAGCLVGGVGGYNAAAWAGTVVYDKIEETYFEALPEESAPR